MTSNYLHTHGRTQTARLVIDLPSSEDDDEEELDEETSHIDNTEGHRHEQEQQQQQPRSERGRNEEQFSTAVPPPVSTASRGNPVQEQDDNKDIQPRHSNAGQQHPIIIDLPSEDEPEEDERQAPTNKTPTPTPERESSELGVDPQKEEDKLFRHEQGEEEKAELPKNELTEFDYGEEAKSESEDIRGKKAKEASRCESNSVTQDSTLSAPPLTTIIVPAPEENTCTVPTDDVGQQQAEPTVPSGAPPSPIPPQTDDGPLEHLTPSMRHIKSTAMGYDADSGRTLEEGKVVALNNSLQVGSSVTFDRQQQQQSGQLSDQQHFQEQLPYPIEEQQQKPVSDSMLSYGSYSFRFFQPNTREHRRDNCRNLLVIFLGLALLIACIIGGVCGSGMCGDKSESNSISSSSFPTQAPSNEISTKPSLTTLPPTMQPSLRPSLRPSVDNAGSPTTAPFLTSAPDTPSPTLEPTPKVAEAPSSSPTVPPSPIPTMLLVPSSQPSAAPSVSPQAPPTPLPTVASPLTDAPTSEATSAPVFIPVATSQPVTPPGTGGISIVTSPPGSGIGIGIGK